MEVIINMKIFFCIYLINMPRKWHDLGGRGVLRRMKGRKEAGKEREHAWERTSP